MVVLLPIQFPAVAPDEITIIKNPQLYGILDPLASVQVCKWILHFQQGGFSLLMYSVWCTSLRIPHLPLHIPLPQFHRLRHFHRRHFIPHIHQSAWIHPAILHILRQRRHCLLCRRCLRYHPLRRSHRMYLRQLFLPQCRCRHPSPLSKCTTRTDIDFTCTVC